jgi:ABC-2 type transport system permease protein
MMGIMVFTMPAIMLSGFVAPVQNMPTWLQRVAMVNPLKHFLVIVRGVFLRGMTFGLVAQGLSPMAVNAIVTTSAAA